MKLVDINSDILHGSSNVLRVSLNALAAAKFLKGTAWVGVQVPVAIRHSDPVDRASRHDRSLSKLSFRTPLQKLIRQDQRADG
jgi:hypothetical protein